MGDGRRPQLEGKWLGFLAEVDRALDDAVEIHCFGGFALQVGHGLERPTADVDFLAAAPRDGTERLVAIAGRGTPLARRHGLYVQYVGFADAPDGYLERLCDVTPASFGRLRVCLLEAHDVALAKMMRHGPKDLSDLEHLARAGALDPVEFERRYREELRPYLSNEAHHDLTLQLWLDVIREA